ncbi:MAG TPA: hypothetical protein VJC13_01630 [Candidatus Paceibacterota bacterium]
MKAKLDQQQNNNSSLQPILFTREQYKELFRAISIYALIKQSSAMPYLDPTGLGDYIMQQGEKFGFGKVKENEADWFDEVEEEVFENIFNYAQGEMFHHLAHMLADRDISMEIEDGTGLSEDELPSSMFMDAVAKRVDMYLKEFEKNGIDNIKVLCKDADKSSLNIRPK